MVEAESVGTDRLSLVRDDITLLEVDAFVFYADHSLKLGSGFGGAVAVRGGPSIQEELDGLGPLETGQVVATAAGELKADMILHAVGPRFREDDLEEKLRETIRNTFALAVEKGAKRVAFPPMGTGFYGVPLDVCARVMFEECERHLAGEDSVEQAIICVQDNREEIPFREQLEKR